MFDGEVERSSVNTQSKKDILLANAFSRKEVGYLPRKKQSLLPVQNGRRQTL
jgi:hypothetical protein